MMGLQQSVQVPLNSAAYIDEASCPNTFADVDVNRCFRDLRESSNSSAVADQRVQVQHGNYAGIDLASADQPTQRLL